MTDTKAPVARADVAAIGSKPGIVRKSGNAFVHGIEIEVSLVTSRRPIRTPWRSPSKNIHHPRWRSTAAFTK